MDPKRIMLLVGSAVLALLAFLMLKAVSGPKHDHPVVQAAAAAPSMSYVAVATRELATGDRISETDMTWQPWPATAVNPAYVTNGAVPTTTGGSQVSKAAGGALGAADALKQKAMGMQGTPGAVFLGAVVKDPIRSGEPMILDKVVRAGQSGVMAVRLEPGRRAMAIPLSAESSAGGFVLPGDHVDVVQTRKLEGSQVAASTVMKNVRVLAIDQSTSAPSKTGSTLGATATLEVSPDQAEALVRAHAQGDLYLVLRSYADTGGPTVEGAVKKLGDALTPQVVKVYRNAQATEVKVAR